VTRAALATRSERRRLGALSRLRGVSVPMASAILTLVDPQRYGVLDIRVWQLLYTAGHVTKNPGGTGFTFDHWSRFLLVVRHFSKQLQVTARDVERSLFTVHRQHQQDRLYARAADRRNLSIVFHRPAAAVFQGSRRSP
jgi:hypothetical protein